MKKTKLLKSSLKLRLLLNPKGKTYMSFKGTEFLRINGIKNPEKVRDYLYGILYVLNGDEGAVMDYYFQSWGGNYWFLKLECLARKTFTVKLSQVTAPEIEGDPNIFTQVFDWKGGYLEFRKAAEDLLAAYDSDPRRVAVPTAVKQRLSK